MFNKTQISYNGKFISDEAVNFHTENRAFLYGDSIFETLRVNNRNILFFDEHLQRLIKGMKVLKYDIPNTFTVFKKRLYEEIIQLLNRNKIFKSSRIRITVFRKAGGLYTPETNKVDYVISVYKLEEDEFTLNKIGLRIGIYKDIKKPLNVFSEYKMVNSAIYTLAGIYKKENSFDDCLILNENNNIAEAISSNVFIVRENKLIFPPVSDGCINGIMRNAIIKIARLYNIVCIARSISSSDLLIADEIFFSNSISGIQWVGAYKNKRYFKKMSSFLTSKLVKKEF